MQHNHPASLQLIVLDILNIVIHTNQSNTQLSRGKTVLCFYVRSTGACFYFKVSKTESIVSEMGAQQSKQCVQGQGSTMANRLW